MESEVCSGNLETSNGQARDRRICAEGGRHIGNRPRSVLEPEHMDEFVAIEPESGDYFLGKALSEATQAARRSYPDRWTHAIRIGHSAALHFGMHVR